MPQKAPEERPSPDLPEEQTALSSASLEAVPDELVAEMREVVSNERIRDRISLSKLRYQDNVLTLHGDALEHEDLAHFLQILQKAASFDKSRLHQMKPRKGPVPPGILCQDCDPSTQVRLIAFEIRITLH